MPPEAILQALTLSAADLPFSGPFDLTPVKDNVYRLSAGARDLLLKWIQDGETMHDEVRANRDGLRGDPIAPPMVAAFEEEGGTIACWEWLDGADLRTSQRHLLPRGFGELGAFHLRRRHDGPVVSPRSRLEHASVAEFVAAEKEVLLPLVDPASRRLCAEVLDRLLLGFGTFIHGDVHPGNIILTADGLRFVDWSLAIPSLNLLDLEFVESLPLVPQMATWQYVPPPAEAHAVLDAYASACGLGAADLRRAHLAVMLWRDLYYLQSFVERSPRRPEREDPFRARIVQMIELAERAA